MKTIKILLIFLMISNIITNKKLHDGYVNCSPDGKKIVFYSYYDEGKTWSISTMNINGSDRKRLTSKQFVYDAVPSWSPNGGKILFSREEKGDYQVWVMNSDGGGKHRINLPFAVNPRFTPDGRIIYCSHWDNTSEIFIANTDGSNIKQLTNNKATDTHPQVSPDGKYIAFSTERDGNKQIYKMNIDGSNPIRLTHNKGRDTGPKFSPDSKKIVFTANHDGDYDIYVMNSDGSELKCITHNEIRDIQANWIWEKK